MKNKLILILFLALSVPIFQSAYANSSSVAEAKFKNADSVVRKLMDIRAAVNNFYDKNTAWPSSLAVLKSNGFYSGDFRTTFNGTIVGSTSGSDYILTVNVLEEKVAAYVARMVTGTNNESVVTMPVPRPVTQAINNTFISRFFDPARPDLNKMSTNLSLGGNNINDINKANAIELNANDLNVSGRAAIVIADIANANLTLATIDNASISALNSTNVEIETGQAKQLIVTNKLQSNGDTVVDGSLRVNATADFLNNTNFSKPVTFQDLAGTNAVVTTLKVENGQAKELTVNNLNSTSSRTDEFIANSVKSNTIVNSGAFSNQGLSTLSGGLTVKGGANLDSLSVSGKAQAGSAVFGELIVSGGTELQGSVTSKGVLQTKSGITNAGGIKTDSLNVSGQADFTGIANDGSLINNGNVVITGNTTVRSSLDTEGGITNSGGLQTDSLNVSSGINNTGGLSTDSLSVSGQSSFDDMVASGGLSVKGDVELGRNVDVKGQLKTNNGIKNKGAIETDDINILNTLVVDGASNFNDEVNFSGPLKLSNKLNLTTDNDKNLNLSNDNGLLTIGIKKDRLEFKSNSTPFFLNNSVSAKGFFDSDSSTYLNSGVLNLSGAPTSEIEIRSSGGKSRIDFSNDTLTDFDARLELTSNSRLSVVGADFFANKLIAETVVADGYYVKDTRNVASKPGDYKSQVSYEFKNRSVVGAPGNSTYSGVTTFAPWGDSSGGHNFQTVYSTTNNVATLAIRSGLANNNWSAWSKVFNENYHPNADRLTNARNISLTGDVTGMVSFDGSKNVSIDVKHQLDASDLNLDKLKNYDISDRYDLNSSYTYASSRAVYSAHQNILERLKSYYTSTQANALFFNRTQADARFYNIGEVTKATVGLDKVNNYGISNSYTLNSGQSYASSKAVSDLNTAVQNKFNDYYTIAAANDNFYSRAQANALFFNRTQADARFYNIGEVTKATVGLDKLKNYGISNSYTLNSGQSYASSKAVSDLNTAVQNKFNDYYTIAAANDNFYSRAQANALFFNRTQADARFYNIGEVTKATVGLDRVMNYGITDNYNLKSSEMYASAKSVSDLRDYVARDYVDFNTGDERYYTIESANNTFFNRTQSDARYYKRGEVTKATVGLDRVMNYGISNSYTYNSSSSYASSRALYSLKGYVDRVSGGELKVHDTRSVISRPIDYNKEVKYEIKNRSVLGGVAGNSDFAGVRTFAPWSDSTGGHSYQTAFTTLNGKPVMSIRSGNPSLSTWGNWSRVLDEESANQLYYRKNDDITVFNSSPVVQIKSSTTTNPIIRLTKSNKNGDIQYDGSSFKLNDDVIVNNSLTVGGAISGANITSVGTLKSGDNLVVTNSATIGGSVNVGGSIVKSGNYSIGTTDDSRIYWAPHQNGAYQWGREFGYNPNINSWYSETSFRAAGLQIHSSKWVLKAVPNNIEAFYDGALAWQIASNKIIHHKQTEFKSDARFKTNATIDNLLTTKKLIVSEDAEVRGDLYVGGDVNIPGWGSLKTRFAQLEEDSTKADNEPFHKYVGLFYTTSQKSVCPGAANANLSKKFHIDLRNHKESDKISVNVKYTGNIKNKTYSSNGASSIESGYFYVWNKTKSNTRTVSRYRVVQDDTNVAIRPYSSFFSLDGGSEYRIDYRIEVDNDEDYCEKVLASWEGGVEFMFSKTPASTTITNT